MKAKLGPVKGLVYDDRQVYRLISNKEVLAVIKQQKEYVCYPWRYIGASSDCAGKLRWLAAFRSKIGIIFYSHLVRGVSEHEAGEDPADLLNNHVFQVLGPPEIFQTDNGGMNWFGWLCIAAIDMSHRRKCEHFNAQSAVNMAYATPAWSAVSSSIARTARAGQCNCCKKNLPIFGGPSGGNVG